MSNAGYSQSRIQFIPNDQPRSEQRNYSDRSLVQLIQLDFTDYTLQALDIDNNRTIIFNIPLKQRAQYKIGKTVNNPDEVQDQNGTYYLWLNAQSRIKFHEALDICFQQISLLTNGSPESPTQTPVYKSDEKSPHKYEQTRGVQPKLPTRSNENGLLIDIYQLGQNIRQGNIDEAVGLAKKLAQQNIPLQASPWNGQREEEIIEVKVKIDSNEPRISNKYKNEMIISVYPSTTIQELCLIFEHCHNFSPLNQYFFVNGHLAHHDSTMKDLNIRSNSLFILFIIQQ
ncbi:unnamed protein product [Adineta steineri]|uniref:Ubiquitin-like domain-containing protein n=1 Tax=Adineta steineri TaxID=433720 RepID=A0A813REK8_9BILA|nr:unnamed protein product [Adineta steineri]